MNAKMPSRIHILLPTHNRAEECAGQLQSVLGEQGISPGRWTVHVCSGYPTAEGRAMLWDHVGPSEWGVEIDDHDKILPGSLSRLEGAIDWADNHGLMCYLYAETWHNGRTNAGKTFLRGMWAKGLRAMRGFDYKRFGKLLPEDAPAESYGTALRAEEAGAKMVRVVGCVLHLNMTDGKMADRSKMSALDCKARGLQRESKARRFGVKLRTCHDFDGERLGTPKERL